jgi:hypothetical protein
MFFLPLYSQIELHSFTDAIDPNLGCHSLYGSFSGADLVKNV